MKKYLVGLVVATACVLSVSTNASASLKATGTSSARAAGRSLVTGPGQTGLKQTDARLDLQDEWRVWQFGYWGCRAVEASGGTPVIFCVWIPAHWVTLPYGAEPVQPGIPYGLAARLRAARDVSYTYVGVAPGHELAADSVLLHSEAHRP